MNELVYRMPETLFDLVECLKVADDNTFLLGGGTDLIIKLRKKAVQQGTIIDMKGVKGLDRIKADGDQISIGANVTYTDIEQSSLLKNEALCLQQMARTVGSKQIRNRAGLPGNIANASKAGDSIPPLIALNASARVIDGRGAVKLVKVEDIITGLGKTALNKDEAIVELIFPRLSADSRTAFGKIGHGARSELTIANASLAMVVEYDRQKNCINRASIVIGAVAQKAFHAVEAEAFLVSQRPSGKLKCQLSELLRKRVLEELGGRMSSWHKANDIQGLAYDAFESIFPEVLQEVGF